MKKLLAGSLVAGMLFAGSAFAAPYGDAGCGLGSLIFKDDPGVVQILAATTNGTSGNQTFGMTTGTLNCDNALQVSQNDQLNQFVAHNMDSLARDIAQGQGETLDTFAELLQIPADQRAEFGQKLQSNFAQVFTSEQVVMANVIDNAVTVAN